MGGAQAFIFRRPLNQRFKQRTAVKDTMKTTRKHTKPVVLARAVSSFQALAFSALFLAAALLFAAGNAWGKNNAGGFTGPGPDVAVTTVEQAKTLPDDSRVVLRGNIVQSLGGKEYLFKDKSGSIIVEIEAKQWAGQEIGPDDLVALHGEVDRDDADVEIDVKRIIKQ